MKTRDFKQQLLSAHLEMDHVPSNRRVDAVMHRLMDYLFPTRHNDRLSNKEEIANEGDRICCEMRGMLIALHYPHKEVIRLTKAFWDALPEAYALMLEDAEAIYRGDPAAENKEEVIRSYPGFAAISFYRIAHILNRLQVRVLPRQISEIAHSQTGIDIHPSASIGRYFCIDHGTGVVIGETTVIGDQVKIYQGVTLGAMSVRKEMAKTKRHPTVEDEVVIYSGATILGGDTVIGKKSVIGGNVWLVESVPANSRVYNDHKVTIR